MNVVISQPMYFPWVGMFEQIRVCDVYVHYDDVQFSKGSFTNRVQIKTNSAQGYNWLTVPLKNLSLGIPINEVLVNHSKDWKGEHKHLLHEAYKNTPYKSDMLKVVDEVFDKSVDTIAELSEASLHAVIDYFDLGMDKLFHSSSKLGIEGHSSHRVFNIVRHFKGDTYITGHGAKRYLDHELFETNGIDVQYMDYQRTPYPQQFGLFNPHVSVLDLIANMGQAGKQLIHSPTQHWREFTVSI